MRKNTAPSIGDLKEPVNLGFPLLVCRTDAEKEEEPDNLKNKN